MIEIKKKSITKDIKSLDKTTDLSRKTKNAYIRTREEERFGHNEDCNYVDDAEKDVREGVATVVRKIGHAAKSYGKNSVEKMKERRTPDADTMHSRVSKQAMEQNTISVKAKETVKQNVSQSAAKQKVGQNTVRSRTKETAKRKYTKSKSNEFAKRRFVQTRELRWANQRFFQTRVQQANGHITIQTLQHPLCKPVEKAAVQEHHKHSVKAGEKAIKNAAKSTVKTTQRLVKTARHTAKAPFKTSKAVSKTIAKTVHTSQRATQAARAAARIAAVSAKTAMKAMVATIKAIIAVTKSLITLIAAGGWIAVAVILLTCLAGLFLGSVFGVFFSNESTGENTPIMTEVVSQLNKEFIEEIQQVQDENPYDTMDMPDNSYNVQNWRDILAVYAVKAAIDSENGMEVTTLDDTKIGILREVFWDLNKINHWVETIEHREFVTTIDKDGEEIEEMVTTSERILHINVKSKSYSDMIVDYSFNAEQVKMLNELMQDKYQQLFLRLIGS